MIRHMLVALADYNNPRSLGSRLRRRRNRLIVELIDAIYSQKKSVRICDLGGRRAYWRDFGEDYLKSRGVHITLVNFEAEISDAAQDPRFTPVCGDACSLSQFADGSFDLAHSNSVIEHVGGWERVKQFAAETRRLAPAYYLQTPYFWCPIEPHFLTPFIHWLPESWRIKIVMLTALGQYPKAGSVGQAMDIVRDAVLLDKTQLRYLLPDASIQMERLFLLPKSLIATRQPGRSSEST
jgi:Methyltransferase domain